MYITEGSNYASDFKKRIGKMLVILQNYSQLWVKYYDNKISISIFKNEINHFENNWGVEFDCSNLDKYLTLLNKWFLKY